jgi:hypothetical protein
MAARSRSVSSASRAVFSMMGTVSVSKQPCPAMPLIISRWVHVNSVARSPASRVAMTADREWEWMTAPAPRSSYA